MDDPKQVILEYARKLGNISLDIGSIKLRPTKPFIWASGAEMPIYNDNRMLLWYPEHRQIIANAFEYMIRAEGIEPDFIAGTSTSGIPPAEALADKMGLPMVYIRDKPKNHGMQNQIEGIDAEKDLEGRTGIVIEDLISTGGSSAKAVQAVRDANANVGYCLSIFNYGFKRAAQLFRGEEPFDRDGEKKLDPECKVKSILTYDILMEVVKNRDDFTKEQIEMLDDWREDAFGWASRMKQTKGKEK